jgi:hypothetical protein
MTIIPTQEVLAIRHVHVGFHPIVIDLPEMMGMELAIWLEAMLVHKQVDSFSNVPDIASIGDPDLALRARLAAERCYRPALVTRLGNLTPRGEELAVQANQILQQIRAYDYELTDPSKWTKINEMIITANFSRRAVQLLVVLNRAIETAIKNHETGADEIIKRFNKDKFIKKYTAINGKTVDTDAEELSQEDEPMTAFTKRTEKHELTDFTGEIYHQTCFVPTAKFNPKAKFDMDILIKFSLLDVRFLRPVGRGRPRMAIKVSDLGTRFLKDLEERQLV